MARPTIGVGAPGGAVALPSFDSLDSTAPPPMMGLGAAAAGFGPQGFDLAAAMAPPPARSLSLGAAAAAPTPPPRFTSVNPGPSSGARVSGGLGSAAMAGMAPPAAARPSALQSAMGEREGEIGALYDALGQPVTYGRKANPMRPIVERDAQNFYGGGSLQLEPFIPPPPEAGEDEWSYMERVQQLQAEDQQRQITEAQTLGDVRDIGRDGHLGMGEAQLQAAENVSAAELQQAERVAEVQRKTAEASRAATAEVRAADAERRDFARQKRDALDQVLAVQADARERLQSLPELDPNRSFKSMEGGAKFWAILGSLAGGAIGSNEVPSRLMEIASRDLDAQKANAAQVFDAAAAADAGVAQQTALYRDLLAAAGDEAAADAMFLQLQLEDAARELEAQLAETTVPKLQAELQQSLVGVRQQIDAQQRAVDVQLASTPKSFLVQTGGLGPRSRKLAEKRVARLEDERFKLQMAGIEGEEKQAERDLKREIEGGKSAKKADAKTAEQAYAFGKDVEKIDTTIAGIDEMLGASDIAGYGFTASPLPEVLSPGKAATNAQIDLVLDELARLKSGAAIGDDEWEMYDKMLRGGTTIGGEERLRENLGRVRKFLASKRDSIERGLDPAVRSAYRRNAGIADYDPQWTGGTTDSVVEED